MRNEQMKEQDHQPLREAITRIVTETQHKVLICPEDMTQMQVGKDLLWDQLSAEVRKKVVWRSRFWLTDEALSVVSTICGTVWTGNALSDHVHWQRHSRNRLGDLLNRPRRESCGKTSVSTNRLFDFDSAEVGKLP